VNLLGWPDLGIAVVVAFAALRGFKRGLVRELTGLVAIGFAFPAAFHYPGTFDGLISSVLHVSHGAEHVVGTLFYAALAYAIVLALGNVLTRATKLPGVNLGNAALGALAGAAKATVFLWALLYVALFFPLGDAVRSDLHRAPLVGWLELPNGRLDDSLRDSLPPVVRPFVGYLFDAHHV